jgi:hypothetical protein
MLILEVAMAKDPKRVSDADFELTQPSEKRYQELVATFLRKIGEDPDEVRPPSDDQVEKR